MHVCDVCVRAVALSKAQSDNCLFVCDQSFSFFYTLPKIFVDKVAKQLLATSTQNGFTKNAYSIVVFSPTFTDNLCLLAIKFYHSYSN